jgi:hypothetical protein
MIPKTALFGAVPAAHGNGASTVSPRVPASLSDTGEDFFSIVSQDRAKKPDQATPFQPPRAIDRSPPSISGVARTLSTTTEEPQATTSGASKTKGQQTSSAPLEKAEPIDASVLGAIMASLAQPDAFVADHPRRTLAQLSDLKIAPGPAEKENTENDDSNFQPSNQKLPGTPVGVHLDTSTVLPPSNSLSPRSGERAGVKGADFVAVSAAPKLGSLDSRPTLQSAIAPVTDAVKTPPNNLPPSNDLPLANPANLAASMPQFPAPQIVPLAAQEPVVSVDGTRAALSTQRMKFAGAKNEVAGRAGQKLPDAPAADNSPGDPIGKADVKLNSDLPEHAKESFDPGSTVYLTQDSPMNHNFQQGIGDKAQSTDTGATQIERVAHLVNQEVVMVRQSGANSLAVSLKVDSHTELFLQLTNHNGQIQASLRCDRGDVEGLGSHWGELQESLARQNVQLMPFEGKISSRDTFTLDPSSDSASSRPFDQPSQNRRQHFPDPAEEPPLATVALAGRLPRRAGVNNRSRRGWETWA